MPNALRYVVHVETPDGETATALTIPNVEQATKIRQIAHDLGLILTDIGHVPDDPEIRRISVRNKSA